MNVLRTYGKSRKLGIPQLEWTEKTNTQLIKCVTKFQAKIANDKNGSYTKNKIILTTDPDLIKEGVQAIDDKFLEWFVKNPSCESVEVEDWYKEYLSCCR